MPDTITTEFLALRDRYIASCFTKLNPVQQQAVFTTEGPLLILAGAGSGKTNSIAWLAHRLTSLHDADNKIIFDNVVIVTDRVVVDRQLQKAIMGMEHKAGLIRVMDDKCNSADLAIARQYENHRHHDPEIPVYCGQRCRA